MINDLIKKNEHQKKVIDRLSRKIQRLKGSSLSIGEITTLLFGIDLIIQNFGDNEVLENIYNKLYNYKKGVINEKKF